MTGPDCFTSSWPRWDLETNKWALITRASLLSVLAARAANCNRADCGAELENSSIFFFFLSPQAGIPRAHLLPLWDAATFPSDSTWCAAEMAEHTDWFFFTEKTVQRCAVAHWNPKSVCLTKHVSHELKAVSRQCLQRPAHTSTRPPLSAVFAVAHCLHVCIAAQKTNGKLWSLKKQQQPWNGISLSFSPTVNRRKLIDEPVSCRSVRLSSPCPCAGTADDFNVCLLFLSTLSGMIYVATLIDVLLRFGCRKSGGVIHDKTEISSFHLIILDVQSRWQWMSKLSSGGPSSTGRQKQIYRAWVILYITLIAFLSLARSLHSSHFKLIFNLGQQLVFKKILKDEGNGDSVKWLIDVRMVVLWRVSIPLGYFFKKNWGIFFNCGLESARSRS